MTARPARILVVGSANVDYAIAVERLPGPGETVSGGTLTIGHGGKGANQAVAARRLGASRLSLPHDAIAPLLMQMAETCTP